MTERYFVDKLGSRTRRVLGPTGGGHLEIGKEVLAANGVVPVNSADVYTQMFRLKYVRVVEHDGGLVEVEHTKTYYGAASVPAGTRTCRKDPALHDRNTLNPKDLKGFLDMPTITTP
jgi:hypothetical protein